MSFYEHFSEAEIAVLRARAEHAAAISQTGAADKFVTALQIRLGHEAYGLPIETLCAVYKGITVVSVPCVPAYVAGIANIRGQIVPVLNLAILLDVMDQSRIEPQALIVVSSEAMTVALAVETIGDVITIAGDDIMALPNTTNTPQHAWLRGVIPNGAGLVDIQAILSDTSLIVSEAAS